MSATRVWDPHRFHADPDSDPAFHFNAGPDPAFQLFTLIQNQIQLPKIMSIHADPDPKPWQLGTK
jgi:hypothetical protein